MAGINIDKLSAESKEKLLRIFNAVGKQAVEEIKDSLAVPYPPPSSPGESPHLRTGELQASIGYSIIGDTFSIYAATDYAEYLEYGTSKLEARPFIRPVFYKLPKMVQKELKSK